jgi:hypothetical protein
LYPLNPLAFAWHTVLHIVEPPWQAARQAAAKRSSFFARVFELGGFSAAARELRMTPSAISKLVGRLETRLGARLVNRSTEGFSSHPKVGCFTTEVYGCSPIWTKSSDLSLKLRSRAEKSG